MTRLKAQYNDLNVKFSDKMEIRIWTRRAQQNKAKLHESYRKFISVK